MVSPKPASSLHLPKDPPALPDILPLSAPATVTYIWEQTPRQTPRCTCLVTSKAQPLEGSDRPGVQICHLLDCDVRKISSPSPTQPGCSETYICFEHLVHSKHSAVCMSKSFNMSNLVTCLKSITTLEASSTALGACREIYNLGAVWRTGLIQKAWCLRPTIFSQIHRHDFISLKTQEKKLTFISKNDTMLYMLTYLSSYQCSHKI